MAIFSGGSGCLAAEFDRDLRLELQLDKFNHRLLKDTKYLYREIWIYVYILDLGERV